MPPKRVYFCKGKCYQRITKISWPLHKIKTVAIHKCDLRFWFRKSWVDVDFCVSFHVVILFCWYDFHWNLVWVAKIRAHLIFQWWMNLKITLNEIISKIIQQENRFGVVKLTIFFMFFRQRNNQLNTKMPLNGNLNIYDRQLLFTFYALLLV